KFHKRVHEGDDHLTARQLSDGASNPLSALSSDLNRQSCSDSVCDGLSNLAPVQKNFE
ncbi:hypothetical protein HAX54_041900, partial [Datura stramonium]|nr:hypothetical protein [Datura stramonium]